MSGVQQDQAESVEQPTQPQQCIKGCGFFANSACNNMCSKCYRDNKLAEERAVSAVQASAKEPSDVVRKVVMPPMPPMPRTSEQRPPSPLASREAASPKPEVQALEAESSETQTATNPILSASQAPQRPPRPGRCYMCSKKIGLAAVPCKCGFLFCGSHRMPEEHECTVDFKATGRQQLAKSNPLIQAEKIDRM